LSCHMHACLIMPGYVSLPVQAVVMHRFGSVARAAYQLEHVTVVSAVIGVTLGLTVRQVQRV
jgi:hypothetical protein